MDPAPEFSRPVPLDQIAERERFTEITASEAERQALARRFGLLGIDRLEARVRLKRSGVFYQLKADWAADVVQSCVVTLEPVANHLEEQMVVRYGPSDQDAEMDLDPEVEAPEPLEGGAIDMGEAVAQALSLALDPYPRKPEAKIEIPGEKDEETGPFASLSRLRRGS
jgi:hypothetical protein